MKKFGKIIILMITMIMVMTVGSVFTSCSNDDDDFRVPAQESQFDQALGQDSVAPITRGTATYTWTELHANDHPTGMRCFYNSTNGWYVFKIYLPEIKISPVYQIMISDPLNNNPTFYKKDLPTWKGTTQGSNALMLINASFFNFDGNPMHVNSNYGIWGDRAEISQWLGKNNSVISQGYDYGSNVSGKQYFRVYNYKAYITTANYTPTYYELLIGGLDPSTVIIDQTTTVDGRTMIGIPSNGNNLVYFFCTGRGGGSTQNQAIAALSDFGCTLYTMLDGGGSSQAYWGSTQYVESRDLDYSPVIIPARRIPVALRMDARWCLYQTIDFCFNISIRIFTDTFYNYFKIIDYEKIFYCIYCFNICINNDLLLF